MRRQKGVRVSAAIDLFSTASAGHRRSGRMLRYMVGGATIAALLANSAYAQVITGTYGTPNPVYNLNTSTFGQSVDTDALNNNIKSITDPFSHPQWAFQSTDQTQAEIQPALEAATTNAFDSQCAQQLDDVVNGLAVTSDILGGVGDAVEAVGAVASAHTEIPGVIVQTVGDGFGLAADGLALHAAHLPNCNAEFTGTILADANIAASQGISAFNGGINIGNADGLTYQGGIAIGGSSISGAGSPGHQAQTGWATSIAIGNDAAALGANSIAFGDGADTQGANQAISIGAGSTATAQQALAVGYRAEATGFRSIALGLVSSAQGQQSIALGDHATAVGDSSVAIGTASQASGNSDVAINAQVSGTSSTAIAGAVIGDQSVAIGGGVQANQSTALGVATSVTADNSVALGYGSVADQNNTVSVGNSTTQRRIVNLAAGVDPTDAVNVSQLQAVQSAGDAALAITNANVTQIINGTLGQFQVDNTSNAPPPQAAGPDSIAAGPGAIASAADSVVIGSLAISSAPDTTVIGHNADATGTNSVVIGSNSSDGGLANVVSIGTPSDTRQIINVADGTRATDAVNLSQLTSASSQTLQSAITYTDLRAAQLTNDLRRVKNDSDAGIAAAMAVGSIPQTFERGKTVVGVGAGTWNGESAFAFGASTATGNGKVIFKVGGTYSTRGDFGGSAGAGIVF